MLHEKSEKGANLIPYQTTQELSGQADTGEASLLLLDIKNTQFCYTVYILFYEVLV